MDTISSSNLKNIDLNIQAEKMAYFLTEYKATIELNKAEQWQHKVYPQWFK